MLSSLRYSLQLNDLQLDGHFGQVLTPFRQMGLSLNQLPQFFICSAVLYMSANPSLFLYEVVGLVELCFPVYDPHRVQIAGRLNIHNILIV